MPAAEFTEAMLVAIVILIAEIICVDNVYEKNTINEDEKSKLQIEFLNFIAGSNKPEAMKTYRTLTGCGLKEAKTHVEELLIILDESKSVKEV